MAVSSKTIRLNGRGDMISFTAYVARMIGTDPLHDEKSLPIVCVAGQKGKSALANVLMETWRDHSPWQNVMNMPKDNKMIFETEPSQATQGTICRTVSVAGKPATQAFNSAVIHNEEELATALKPISDATNGVLILSNLRHRINTPDTSPILEMYLKNYNRLRSLIKGDIFHCDVETSVLDSRLLSQPRFATYWHHLEDRSKWNMPRETSPARVLALRR